MLDIKGLSIEILKDNRKLIDKLSFSLNDGDKLAIIGEEGNGKSTIVKAIACQEKINSYAKVSGQIVTNGKSVGYLEQFLDENWNDQEIYRFFLKDNSLDDDDYEKFKNFKEIERLFAQLLLDEKMLNSEQKIGTLSGGEKVKLQLAKLLFNKPDILILDEPTNDLDIETLNWLENFILSFTKPIIYISHDEALLENTANAILHVEQLKKKTENKCTFARLSYREYIDKRLNDIAKQNQQAAFERAQDKKQQERWNDIYNKVDHQLNSISRQDPHGARLLKKKMASVKAQEKRFERERKDFTDFRDQEEAIYLDFGDNSLPNSKVVCDERYGEIKIQDLVLCENVELKVVGREKLMIVGNNGVGKSTFIKKLTEDMIKRKDIIVGYMPQNYTDQFSGYNSVFDYLLGTSYDKNSLTKIRTYLGSMKFTHEEMLGKIEDLSGGQKAKVFLAKLMVKGCNVLILDEPTRNLSPLSNPVIRKALSNFNGAIIAVSHDRKFISEVGTKVLKLTKTGFLDVSDKFYSTISI